MGEGWSGLGGERGGVSAITVFSMKGVTRGLSTLQAQSVCVEAQERSLFPLPGTFTSRPTNSMFP